MINHLTPAKLEPLSALVIFLQQDSALNTPEMEEIKHVLEVAISTNNFTREYVDPIYDANFAGVTELIGDRKEELLREAANVGNKLAVSQLLKVNGVDVNAKSNYGRTALMYASQNGHADIVIELLKVNGIDVNAQDKDGWTALMWASNNGHAYIVTALLMMNDIQVNTQDNDGMTALMCASRKGYSSVVTELLKADGIQVNIKNNNGWTALMYASSCGHASIVTELLKMNGIDVNAKSKSGWAALMWAASAKHTAIAYQLCIKQLFDAPFDQGNAVFQQLTNEIKSVRENMTINPASLCANLLICVEALPSGDEKITLLEKAVSGKNGFSALMQKEQRLQLEAVLTKLKSSNSTQPVLFSEAAGAPSSSSNPTANTSFKLIRSECSNQ